jgi:hypothetical protein
MTDFILAINFAYDLDSDFDYNSCLDSGIESNFHLRSNADSNSHFDTNFDFVIGSGSENSGLDLQLLLELYLQFNSLLIFYMDIKFDLY